MIRLMKSEIWKSFHCRSFRIALVIGLGIQSLNLIYNIYYLHQGVTLSVDGGYVAQSRSLFIRWISADGWTLGYYLLWFLFPLLAALPFGDSLLCERKSGYMNQMLCKVPRAKYYLSKYAAVFLSGGSVIGITLLVNLLINALIVPAAPVESYTSLSPVLYEDMASVLFYTHPWAYSFLWVGISFLWGGVLAGACMLFSVLFSKRIFALAAPFVLLRILDAILPEYYLSPTQYLLISTYISVRPLPLFVLLGLTLVLGLVGGLLLFQKTELV